MSCMIVVAAGCMTGSEAGLDSGNIGLMVEGCMMCEPFRLVDTRLEALSLNTHPVAHYEKNSHRHFPATKSISDRPSLRNHRSYRRA